VSLLVQINLLLVVVGPFVVVGAVTGIAVLGGPDLLGRPAEHRTARSRRSGTALTDLTVGLAFGWLPNRTATLLARH
jgi:hypothetical protein